MLPAPNNVEHPENEAVDEQARQTPPVVEDTSDEQGAPSNARTQRLAKRIKVPHADTSTMQHELDENITPAQHPSLSGSIVVSFYFSTSVTR